MANTVLTHDMLAKRALFDLKNNLTMARHVYKGYNDEFHSVGRFQKGNSVRIALPNRYRTKSGAAMDVVDLNETNTSITLDQHNHVAFQLLETELTYSIEAFSKKHLHPATIALANKVDNDLAGEYTNVYNLVGTAGTAPATFGVIVDAMVRMNNEAVPMSPRVGIISPKTEGALMDGELKGLFSQKMVETLVRKGFERSGQYAGFDFYMDQNVRTMTCGTRTGSITVKTQPAEGATTLALQAAGNTKTIVAGEVFTVATVHGVNPIHGGVWEGSELRQFVVTALATSDAGGDVTVNVLPKIYSSAAGEAVLPYQSVDDLPAVSDAVTFVGTLSTGYPQNLLFHPDAFALTMVPFNRPSSAGKSVAWAQASDEDIGLSITIATAFDITNYRENTRLDVLYGTDTIQSNYACRLIG